MNETQVNKVKRLSDHTYYYSIEEGKIFLVKASLMCQELSADSGQFQKINGSL